MGALRNVVLIATMAILMTSARSASAVPAWVRLTGLPCASCHVGGSSKLNNLGRDFQLRGHRLQGGTTPQRVNLFDYVSVAAKLRYADADSRTPAYQFQTADVFAGGPLSRHTGFFAEYMPFDRSAKGSSLKSALFDAYLQYVDAPDSSRFWWARAGNIYPYQAYLLGGGGRLPLSRPRLISDALGGAAPALLRRSIGVSSGFDGDGNHIEAGLRKGEGEFGTRPETFVSLDRDLGVSGLGVGLFGRNGIVSGAGQSPWFTQTGVTTRWQGERQTLTGAYLMTDSQSIRSDSYLAEVGYNLLPETTSFVRFDDVAGAIANGPRSRTVAFGITQRIPKMGRVVLEFADGRAAGKPLRTVQLDILLLK